MFFKMRNKTLHENLITFLFEFFKMTALIRRETRVHYVIMTSKVDEV